MTDTLRILHVDDDREFADLTAAFLERERDRFEVVIETSAADALARLETEHVDCVVSDYQMPDTDGLELLDAVREAYPDLPVILFTNQGSEEVAAEAIERGVTSYLQKETGGTVQYTILANRIGSHVRKYRAERELRRERDRLSALFENTPDPIMEVDFEDGTPIIDDVNPAFEETFGIDAEEAIGGIVAETVVPEGERETHERLRDRVFRGESVEAEVRRETATGVREFMLRIIPVDVEEVSSGAYAWYTDVTERVERERELEQLTERFRAFTEHASDLISVVDGTGVLQYHSPSVERILGYEQEELVGENAFEYIHPEDRERVQEAFLEMIDHPGNVTRTVEFRFERADGSWVWLESVGSNQTETAIDGYVITSRDVTERRERERELEGAKRRFDAVFNNPIAFMALLDPDGTVTEVNETALEFVERSPEEVLGEPFPETPWWDHSEDLQGDLRSWVDRAAAGEVVRFEADHYGPGGERVTIDGVLHPIRDEEGAVTSVLAAGRDISERKARERELRRTKERLQRVFEGSNDAIMIVDVESEAFVEVNRAACEMLGYAREELLALDPEEIHPDDTDRVREAFLSDVEETGAGWTDDITCVRKDGEEIPTEISGAPLRTDADGSASKMVAILRDISEQVAYERELERQKRELERQNERLEKFVDTVSHDLRNPLSVAQGRLEFVGDGCDDEHEHLDAVADALDRMGTLIEDLLALARQGETPGEITAVGLGDVVETSWQNVDTRDATLRVETDRAVRADRGRLAQLFENLVRNAVEHGSTGSRPEADDAVEHGGEDVTVTVGELDDGFYVEDDGPGIDPDDRDQVFASGYSTTDDGTGFGLSIVGEIVDAHGWEIRVTEGSGGGARFEITGVETTAE